MGIIARFVNFFYENPIYILLGFLVYVLLFVISVVFSKFNRAVGKNPFKLDRRKIPANLVTDQRLRDKVLKCGFSSKKLNNDAYDCIVIGSGIGGLITAAILSKTGKKVLVLEQHDQAGGCCHTFIEDGFEFDVGIHYIGEMDERCTVRFLFDQLTEGQLQWVQIEQEYDKVAIGGANSGYPLKLYSILSGKADYRRSLLAEFPDEEKAIDGYLNLLVKARKSIMGFVMIKVLPKFISKFLIKLNLINWLTPYFKNVSRRTVQQTVESLTNNKKLQLIFSYNFGDYGTLPDEASWAMQAILSNHYLYGAYYPIGGASEIAFHLIPTIEKNGGKVLVRALVSKILTDVNGKAIGVRVKKGEDGVDIMAKLIISDAGLNNTLHRLLPNEIAKKSPLYKNLETKHIKPGLGCMSLFVGLKGSTEELGIKGQHVWSYPDLNVCKSIRQYYNLTGDELLSSNVDIPLLFIGFPSAKDPTYAQRFPGKSTCTVITLAKWDWFSDWKDDRVKHRGDNYDERKLFFKNKMWKQVLELYPQLEDKVEFMDIGTPVSNNFYIGSLEGETYGLDHNHQRFANSNIAMNLRPDIGVNGLLLTGQDIFSAGLVGAGMAGVICAAAALNRNLMKDLAALRKKCAEKKKNV